MEEKRISLYDDRGTAIQLSSKPVTPEDNPQKGQVKAIERESTWQYFLSGRVIENPNNFFSHTGALSNVIEQTNKMDETDPYLAGLIQIRKMTLLAKPREIVGEDSEVKQFVIENFAGITNMHSKLEQMLACLKVGCSMMEMIWHPVGDKWWIVDLLSRKQTQFTFKKKKGFQPDGDYQDELRARESTLTDGKKLPPNKFLVTTFDEQYGNRWGISLYHRLYWYWFIKRNILNFWQIFLENYVTPIVVAKGTVTDDGVSSTLDSFIQNIKNRMGIRIPESIALEFVQAKQDGAQTYLDAVAYFDRAMAFLVLGNISVVDNGTSGSYARDRVKDKVTRKDIIGSDIAMLESVINDCMIPPLVDYNFANVTEYPKFRIIAGEVEDMEMMAKVIEIMSRLGLPITEKFIYETFGMKQPKEGDELLKVPEGFGQTPAAIAASMSRRDGVLAKYYRDLDKDMKSIT
jgi:phage gp29-like protein